MTVAAVIVGGLLGIALLTLAVVMVRDKGKAGGGGESDSADVSSEKFKQVHSAMTIEEVEKILGRGSMSSLQDFLRASGAKGRPAQG